MSQASRILKSIAASPEYRTLVEAMKTPDYESICRSYLHVWDLLEKPMTEVLEGIQSLSRTNKGEDCQRFQSAIFLRTSTILPEWHRLNSLLKQEGLEEGQVVGFGSKSDPLVRTSEGRTIVLTHCALTQGQWVRFKVVAKTREVDFGQVVELTPDYLYQIIKQEILVRIRVSLDTVRECLITHQTDSCKDKLADLSCLLTELEGVRELASKLQVADRERVVDRVLAYRRRLLDEHGVNLIFDFLSQKEEKEIRQSCQGDEERLALALLEPGLLNHGAHQALKTDLFVGEELRKYVDIQQVLRSKPDDIDIAMELMELKLKTEKAYPLAKEYVKKMNTFFARLHGVARKVCLSMAEERICSVHDIQSAIEKAFSDATISGELRKSFSNAEEFYSLRSGLAEIRTILDDYVNPTSEARIQNYLNHRIALAFEDPNKSH